MRGDTFRDLAAQAREVCRYSRLNWMSICLCFAVAGATTCIAQDSGKGNAANSSAAVQTTQSATGSANTDPAKAGGQEKNAATGGDKKKQIADESTELLSMALALKAEVDKTTKDTLSMNVIRKADEIERLAHTVKEKMK